MGNMEQKLVPMVTVSARTISGFAASMGGTRRCGTKRMICGQATFWSRPRHMIPVFAGAIRLVCISVLFLTVADLARAADHGQFGPISPEVKAWANSLENKLKEGCCSTADGWRPQEVEYDMKGNKYRVKIEGDWYDVPAAAVIDVPNRFGFPVVWYYKTWDNGIRPSISIRCFIPGAGG
jgi:hypothetical protein